MPMIFLIAAFYCFENDIQPYAWILACNFLLSIVAAVMSHEKNNQIHKMLREVIKDKSE